MSLTVIISTAATIGCAKSEVPSRTNAQPQQLDALMSSRITQRICTGRELR
jgi:hypothetical protein